MEKKYELTKETIKVNGHILHRIRALKDFSDVNKGDLGGFVESEENLSHKGKCWVYNDAKVYGSARVYNSAKVFGNAEVYDNAKVCDFSLVYDRSKIYGDARIYDKSKIFENSEVYGHVNIYDNAKIYGRSRVFDCSICGNSNICGNVEASNIELSEEITLQGDAIINSNSDFIIFRKFWGNGEYIVYTRSNNLFFCENFYGNEEEFIKHELEKYKEYGVNISLFIEFIKMIKYGKEV